MIDIDDFISNFSSKLKTPPAIQPWQITNNIVHWMEKLISYLDNNYSIKGGIAIHKTAIIEMGVVMKKSLILRQKNLARW